jgi:ABC-type glycerol-3-phosphate transport system permease component
MLPIAWSISIAFDRQVMTYIPTPLTLWPREPSLAGFKYAFQRVPVIRYFRNTLFLAVINTVISVFFALCCGYAFAQGRFFLKRFWLLFMLAVMMIPFEAIMLPLFLQYRDWRLLNTYAPLIFGSFAWAYGVFLAMQSMSQLPDSLREAAFIDGANEWRIFFSIIIPLSAPTIATLSILRIISEWNSFLWPLITVTKDNLLVLSVGISLFNASRTSQYISPRVAVAVISAIPLTLLFLFLQKWIVRSIALSGIKQ